MKILTYIFSIILLLTISNELFGQDYHTKEMEYDGAIVEVTRDIDTQYWGTYIQSGKYKTQYAINVNGESFFLKQTLVDPLSLEYSWEHSNKELIDWGVLVKDGKIVTHEVNDYVDGEMKSYEAMVFIYKNHKTGETMDLYLYDDNGLVTLGYAQKINDFANNR
ncbi:MAG: hypothetical protein GY810_32485 [Aureispira sp.]|nr:hypothetical protein [Aureispira sp.]